MKVGIDGRSLAGGSARGVGHYTSALLAALAAEFPEDEYRVLLAGTRSGSAASLAPGLRAVTSRVPGRLLFASAALTGRPRLDRLLGADCDVIWAPAPAPLALGDTPFVLTVHDRAWERRPRDFTRYERLWHALARPRSLARRADRVIAVTAAGRRDLIAAWRLPADVVRTVRSAPFPAGERGRLASPPARFLLFVGALEPRKAPDVLAAAFRQARADGLDAELVVVGTGRLRGKLDGPGVRCLERVSRGQLSALYRDALALVAPSHLEGFGLPALEALAQGTPAIVSDLPETRELLGDHGARFVAPGDVDALVTALLEIAADAGLRAALAAAGSMATAGLSWTATARATRAVLAEAAAR